MGGDSAAKERRQVVVEVQNKIRTKLGHPLRFDVGEQQIPQTDANRHLTPLIMTKQHHLFLFTLTSHHQMTRHSTPSESVMCKD